MYYLTVEDLKARFPRAAPPSGVSSAQLAGFIQEAGGEADSYIAQAGITVPVSPAPDVLVGKVAVLAFGFFQQRNVHESGRESGIAGMMKDVRDWLQKVADGKVTLVMSGGAVAAGLERASLWTNLGTYTPTFGAGDVEDAVVDQDRIDAEEDAR